MVHPHIQQAPIGERTRDFLAQAETARQTGQARPAARYPWPGDYRARPGVAAPGMLRFLVRKMLPWALLAIAAPLLRVFARRLFRAVLRHAVVKPAARALREADSAVTDVSRDASGKTRQLTSAGR